MHIARVCESYQGYKSIVGFHVPFDGEIISTKNPFLESPKGTHPRRDIVARQLQIPNR